MGNQIVKVNLGNRSYDIIVGADLLRSAGKYIAKVIGKKNVIIITDKHVNESGHLGVLEESLLKSNIESNVIILPPGEKTKSFSELEKLLEKLLSFRPDRKTTLIALGGGVIGDITGFAASILLRGIDFIQIPTTLLAMVDSSVGGKTGINTKYGKNLIGTFYQPRLVLADVKLLLSLPNREYLAGYAEVIKYALITDEFKDEKGRTMFEIEERNADFNLEEIIKNKSLESQSMDMHINRVRYCCMVKASIVERDEKESGIRALLNLGHTFGHALEAETGFSSKLLHGEAVAIGMVMAFQFSHLQKLCKKEDVVRVIKHFEKVGLPTSPLDIKLKLKASRLLDHMRHDKKVKDGKMVLVLVKGIGKAFVQEDVDEKKILRFLESSVS